MEHRKRQTKTSQLVQLKLRTSGLSNRVLICYGVRSLLELSNRFKRLVRLGVAWEQRENFPSRKESFFFVLPLAPGRTALRP
jgi:hypothetical protein